MEALRLKPRQPVEEQVEDWDDGDFEMDGADLSFRSSSTQQHVPTSRRNSQSSVMSLRSELESMQGDDRLISLQDDNEISTQDAIASASQAGIPIPQNVPSSALMGGTIKRLGGRKIKKIIEDDWENDLELPDSAQALRIKAQDASQFPDQLRQVSGPQSSPSKASKPTSLAPIIKDDRRESNQSISSALSGATNLDKFRDNDDDDDDFFGEGSATIKVSKTQPSKPLSLITPPTPQKDDKPAAQDEGFEDDFELPSDGKLKLSSRRNIPKTPSSQADDLDWGEGSLGTRFGGTRRDGRSNRSSSASALSPSVSSSFTAESEDDNLDGLVLPSGPVNFEERLKRQRTSLSPIRSIEEEKPSEVKTPLPDADKEDFFTGLDVGEGDVFDSGKLTLHRNLRVNTNRPASPARPKTSVSVTFTNSKAGHSRLPKPTHERAHSSSLEPVYESGGPTFSKTRRSQSRLGHSSQGSVTSLPTPTLPSPSSVTQPGTPQRREIGGRTSTSSLRTNNEPTTTNSQLLRFKRSLPVMRGPQSPAKPPAPRYERPPSRNESSRPQSILRPKTPVEKARPLPESSASSARKPFLPAGASSQFHHGTSKSSRSFRRHDSEHSIDLRPASRAISRATMRSPSPQRQRANQVTPGGTRGEFYQIKSKNFGQGNELDAFDDLPTSAEREAKYTRQPTKAPLRNRLYQNIMPDRTNTPSPAPSSPAKMDHLPHFARDTAASRIARETSLAQRVPSSGPLAPLTTQRVAQLSSRSNFNPGVPQSAVRSKKSRKPAQTKPYLISNMNKDQSARRTFFVPIPLWFNFG